MKRRKKDTLSLLQYCMYFCVKLKKPLSVHVCDVNISPFVLFVFFYSCDDSQSIHYQYTLRLLQKHVVLFEVFLCLDSSQKSRAELYLFSFQLCQELTAMINEGEEDFNKQGRHAVQLVASCMLVCRGFVFQTKLRAVFWNQWPSLHTRLAFELEIFWIKPVLVKASAGFDLLAISRSKSWTHFYTVTPSPRLFQFHRFTVVKGFFWANTQRQT